MTKIWRNLLAWPIIKYIFRGILLLGKEKKRAAKEICQYGDHAHRNKGPPN
jgi:hypothetical protein